MHGEQKLGDLDETKCALRLLICLSQIEECPIQIQLHNEMRKRFGLGRKVVDSSLEVCIKLKLVKRETRRVGSNPMPSLFHSLTPQGKKIASILMELESALV